MDFMLCFTDKEITPWAGMGLMKQMLDRMGFAATLASPEVDLPQPGSNRAYPPAQLMTQFMLSVWCGAKRFEHAEVTRFDGVLGKLFGYERMANFKTIGRLFDRFDQAQNTRTFGALYQWMFAQVGPQVVTLDMDSTVLTRYGQQQGSAKGYNPVRRGRSSHHPLLAFVADTRMIANCWLRPGNSHTANNCLSFLEQTREHLKGKSIGLFRADSGFFERIILQHLEKTRAETGKATNYIIAARLTQPIQRALAAQQGWWAIGDKEGKAEGIEICDIQYQAAGRDAPRRLIAVRQHIARRENAKGKTLSLFADMPEVKCWRYAAMCTNLDLPAEQIWRLYRGRADCENRIKELKYDFGFDSFCRKDFWGTEAALQTVMLAYNFMSIFRQALLKKVNTLPQAAAAAAKGKDPDQTLQTLRYKLFATPGYITTQARKPMLKMALAMQRREWMSGLWDKSKSFDLPVCFTQTFRPDG